MSEKIFSWLDERLGLQGIYDTILDRKVPKVNWWFTLGSASLFLGALQGITGILLSVYYVPTPDHAYDSITFIMTGVKFGWLIRGMHHWGASLLILTAFIHMLRVFFYGAYKYPREVTWITGSSRSRTALHPEPVLGPRVVRPAQRHAGGRLARDGENRRSSNRCRVFRLVGIA